MKRIIAIILLITFITVPVPKRVSAAASVWDGASVNSAWGADYASTQIFEINTAADFIAFRNKVCDGNTFSGKTVNLNCDIDLGNYNLRYGIGKWTDFSGQWWSYADFFMGKFNGNGHIITNITMDQTKPDAYYETSDENGAVGLFCVRGANIINLCVDNVTIVLPATSTVSGYYGGFASISYVSPISNCCVKNISFSGGWSSGSPQVRIAGFSAYHREGNLTNVYASGISFSGLKKAMMSGTFVGGLVCAGDGETNISHCYSADVTKNSSGSGNFDRAVFILNPGSSISKIHLTNVYTDDPTHIGQGTEGSGETGSLEDALLDFDNAFGDSFQNLSYMGMNPILAWEKIPGVKVSFTGDYTDIIEVGYGEDAVLPTAPTGYHYTFKVDGNTWNGKNITEDVTVTVTKEINTYAVTYTGDYEGSDSATHGGNVTLPVAVGGIYVFDVNGIPWDGQNITEDVTVNVRLAMDICTVTFSGDCTGEQVVIKGEDAVLPTAPTGYHYIFKVSGSIWDGQNITEDVTVTVTKEINTYTVTYTGDYEGSGTATHGWNAILPVAPSGYCYIFEVNGSAWDGQNITEDVTVTVKNAHIVKFIGDYEGEVTVIHGENTERPTAPSGSHYIFEADGAVWNGQNITENVTVTVKKVSDSLQDGISVWDGVSANADWAASYNPDYNVAQTFEINSAEDFIAFRNKILEEKDNNPFYGKTVNLNCDINLDNHNLRYGLGAWTDFSGQWYQKGYFFRGTFNGNGHVIKNIMMDQTKPDAYYGTSDENGAVGLFTADYAVINKLGVENVTVVLPNSGISGYYGGFASISYRTAITSCYAKNVKFKGGWSGGSATARLAGFSAYHRNNSLKNVYVSDVDFTGLNSGVVGVTFIGGLVCSGDGDTNISNCYSTNVKKYTEGSGSFDGAVFILNPNSSKDMIKLSNVYTDNMTHTGQGTEGSGNTGNLDDILSDVENTLGNGYVDLSTKNLYPILVWEKIPDAFSCQLIELYENYGTAEQKKIEYLNEHNGIVTAVIKDMKNNTGADLENGVICIACICDKALCGVKSQIISIPKSSSIGSDIILTLDLSGVTVSSDGFVQILAYKGENIVIPIMPMKKITR